MQRIYTLDGRTCDLPAFLAERPAIDGTEQIPEMEPGEGVLLGDVDGAHHVLRRVS